MNGLQNYGGRWSRIDSSIRFNSNLLPCNLIVVFSVSFLKPPAVHSLPLNLYQPSSARLNSYATTHAVQHPVKVQIERLPFSKSENPRKLCGITSIAEEYDQHKKARILPISPTFAT